MAYKIMKYIIVPIYLFLPVFLSCEGTDGFKFPPDLSAKDELNECINNSIIFALIDESFYENGTARRITQNERVGRVAGLIMLCHQKWND